MKINRRLIKIVSAAFLVTNLFWFQPSIFKASSQEQYSVFEGNEEKGIEYINFVRKELNIQELKFNSSLSQAAAAHSLYSVMNHHNGHNESPSKPYFVGTWVEQRAKHFGYIGETAEVIAFQRTNSVSALDALLDAPYHRYPLLNPQFNEIGIGYMASSKGLNPTVVNLGRAIRPQISKNEVVYPYKDMENAKTSWYINESPNPLRFEGIDSKIVGYPISINFYGNDVYNVTASSVILRNGKGEHIPYYLVDGKKDPSLKSIFVIPKEPLEYGEQYRVQVISTLHLKNGTKRYHSNVWNFKTLEQVKLSGLEIHKNVSGVKFLKAFFNSGDFDDLTFVLTKQDKKIQTYNENNNKKYSSYRFIEDGEYELDIRIPSQSFEEIYTLMINGDKITYKKKKEAENPSSDVGSNPSDNSENTDTPGTTEGDSVNNQENPPAPPEDDTEEEKTLPDLSKFVEVINPIKNVSDKQSFRLSLFGELDENSVNTDNVFILKDGTEEKHDISVSATKKTITITPNVPYEKGAWYAIYLDDTIKNSKGEPIKKAIKIRFSVKE